jgi:hypothetical protein
MPTEEENGYDPRRGPRDRALRVGDREREAVTEILRRHHVEGRLDADEFQERLERCLVAKTHRDLDRLIDDLPNNQTEQRRLGRARALPFWRVIPLPLALIPLAIVAAIVVSGGHLFWVAVPLLFFFALRQLLWRSWACDPRTWTRTGPRV